MKQVLNNILSVLLWRPDRYQSPSRAPRVAVLCAVGTLCAGVWLFGLDAVFVLALAYLVAIVTFPCKILIADNVSPAALATQPVFTRGLFAASVSTWPLGLAIAGGLPAALIVAIAMHAALEVWLQVLPLRELAATTPEPAGDGLVQGFGGWTAHRRFKAVGPPIGTFGGSEIAAWFRDDQDVVHDYAGCTSDLPHFRLQPGQTLLSTGLVYEVRSNQGGPRG